VLLEHLGVRSLGVYTAVGVAVWVAFVKSGVHATIAGVMLGLLTPARPYLNAGAVARLLESGGAGAERARALQSASRESVSPLEYLEHRLHPWVSFVVMPLFALANAGVHFSASELTDRVTIAVAIGLLAGKPIGVVASSWLAVTAGAARLPDRVGWASVAGGGLLCGIGFTMALFVANLALTGPALGAAKVGILIASALAAGTGMVILFASAKGR
jgi:NhaA family Na+:H+ antiporter